MPRKKDKTTKEKIEEAQLQLEKLKQDLATLKQLEKEEKRKAVEEEIMMLGKAVRYYKRVGTSCGNWRRSTSR